MPVKILYFSFLREKLGKSEEIFIFPDTVPASEQTLQKLITLLSAGGEPYALLWQKPHFIQAAVNQIFADELTLLHPGDEVAFFPPVTGG